MVTVMRAEGLRVVIYLNDHDPAHVHVFGDGEAKINLIGVAGTPQLVWADSMPRGEIRRAMRMVGQHQTALLQRWEDMHGRSDRRSD
jgi:hypothetical protein